MWILSCLGSGSRICSEEVEDHGFEEFGWERVVGSELGCGLDGKHELHQHMHDLSAFRFEISGGAALIDSSDVRT